MSRGLKFGNFPYPKSKKALVKSSPLLGRPLLRRMLLACVNGYFSPLSWSNRKQFFLWSLPRKPVEILGGKHHDCGGGGLADSVPERFFNSQKLVHTQSPAIHWSCLLSSSLLDFIIFSASGVLICVQYNHNLENQLFLSPGITICPMTSILWCGQEWSLIFNLFIYFLLRVGMMTYKLLLEWNHSFGF